MKDLSKITVSRVALTLLVMLCGCGDSPKPGGHYTVDKDNAFQLVKEIVSHGPRPSGSVGAARTAQFIKSKCNEYGYESTIEEWRENTPRGKLTFRNIYATLNGNGRSFIILGSHYDTKNMSLTPGFVGANDSASSTGLLLEIMRVLKTARWRGPTIRFAFFDGEEAIEAYAPGDGLHGSKKLASTLRDSGEDKRCKAMILLDMIGDKDLTITLSPDDDAVLIEKLLSAAEEQNVRQHFGFFLHGTIVDDHIPFRELDIPTLDIIDFDYGPNNSYWHTDLDTIDKLSPDSLKIIGNVTLALLAGL